MCVTGLDQVQVPRVPTCVLSTAEPLAARTVKWECPEVQSSGNGRCAKCMTAGNNVQWEQRGPSQFPTLLVL